MFEKVLLPRALDALARLAPHLDNFYLAGGTGLALQLEHRQSDDFDFFSTESFNPEAIAAVLNPDYVFKTTLGSFHCEIDSIAVSLLYYEVPLVFLPISWRKIKVAHWKDIASEKLKTIAQRGSKKDFVDIYAVLKLKTDIPDVCRLFRQRFEPTGINMYHIVKSLVFFEDAEGDPNPQMLLTGPEWDWDNIKAFFLDNIKIFERELDCTP